GEELKQIKNFPGHIRKISKVLGEANHRGLTIIVVGGGSVGDFGGFVASVYRRGVNLIHIPSTWLAAVDSSHGGKTALNVFSVKNQIGSFYPAKEIYLLEPLLATLPRE